MLLSRNFIAGHGFSLTGDLPTAFRPPGYPVFLALPAFLDAGILPARLANFLALSASIVTVFLIARHLAGAVAGLCAAFLTAAYPLFFFTAGAIYPQTLGGLLLLASVYWLYVRAPRMRHAAVSGVLAGWLVLTVPSFVISLPLLAIGAWLRKRQLQVALVFTVTASLVIGAWTARNLLVFEKFVFVSSNSGLNLLLGNSENTTPTSGVNVDISRYVAGAAGMNEIDQDAYYRQQAIAWMRENPGQAALMYLRKVAAFFHFRNELQTAGESSQLRDAVVAVSYYPLLFVTLVGLVLFRRSASRLEWLLSILYLSGAFGSAVFFPRIRFRLPYDHLLIILAATSVTRWIALRWPATASAMQMPSLKRRA